MLVETSPWFNINQIGRIQIELTNYCNAACPQCDRYEQLVEFKNGKSKSLDLNNSWFTKNQIEEVFGNYKWDSLEYIHYCGNVDEPTINPEMLEITEYFQNLTISNIMTNIGIATNGGTRDEQFWTELGKLSKNSNIFTVFGLDGLEDTNHIYRRNVRWEVVQRNWRAYIKAGGKAVWQFILFNHNKHQLDEAKELADKEGFIHFKIVQSGRADVLDMPDNNQNIAPSLKIKNEKIKKPKWYDDSGSNSIDGMSMAEFKEKNLKLDCVRCAAKLDSNIDKFHKTLGNIYISSKGYAVPCCWMGNPRELELLWNSAPDLDKSTHNVYNKQLHEIINGDWWSHIDKQMQEYKLCKFKCKDLIGDIHL
jgi:MoaA/NifB/PqqE/SkfB family radical SAM enzyme